MRILATAPLDLSTSANLAALGCVVHVLEPGQDLSSAIDSIQPDMLLVDKDTNLNPADLKSVKLVVLSDLSTDSEMLRSQGVNTITSTTLDPAQTADMIISMALDAVKADPAYEVRMAEMGTSHPLEGLVIGLIGFGEVGKHLRDRAEELHMPVVVYSTHLADEGADEHRVRRMPDVRTLAAQADVITVHQPLRADTVGLLDEAFFAAMKPSAVLINTSSSLIFARDPFLKFLGRNPNWISPVEIVDTPEFPALGILQEVQKYRSDRIGM